MSKLEDDETAEMVLELVKAVDHAARRGVPEPAGLIHPEYDRLERLMLHRWPRA